MVCFRYISVNTLHKGDDDDDDDDNNNNNNNIQGIKDLLVGSAPYQNGETSYFKQSPATNISQHEKNGKAKGKMGRRRETGCRRATWHTGLEN
jgi:hypothetical protein